MTPMSLIIARVLGAIACLGIVITAVVTITTPLVLWADPQDMSWFLWGTLMVGWVSFGFVKIADALFKENGLYQ